MAGWYFDFFCATFLKWCSSGDSQQKSFACTFPGLWDTRPPLLSQVLKWYIVNWLVDLCLPFFENIIRVTANIFKRQHKLIVVCLYTTSTLPQFRYDNPFSFQVEKLTYFKYGSKNMGPIWKKVGKTVWFETIISGRSKYMKWFWQQHNILIILPTS